MDEDDLTVDEREFVERWLGFYEELADGRRPARTPAQVHFVEVCSGRAVAETDHERAFVKFRRLAIRERLGRAQQRESSSPIPEREEGTPGPDFFTREDALKLRRRQLADLRRRSRED